MYGGVKRPGLKIEAKRLGRKRLGAKRLVTAKITENIRNSNITVRSSGHLSFGKKERFNHYLHYRGENQFKRAFLIARVTSLTPEVWILFP